MDEVISVSPEMCGENVAASCQRNYSAFWAYTTICVELPLSVILFRIENVTENDNGRPVPSEVVHNLDLVSTAWEAHQRLRMGLLANCMIILES